MPDHRRLPRPLDPPRPRVLGSAGLLAAVVAADLLKYLVVTSLRTSLLRSRRSAPCPAASRSARPSTTSVAVATSAARMRTGATSGCLTEKDAVDSTPGPGTTLPRTATLEARSLKACPAWGGDQTHSSLSLLAILFVWSTLLGAPTGCRRMSNQDHVYCHRPRQAWTLRRIRWLSSCRLLTQFGGEENVT